VKTTSDIWKFLLPLVPLLAASGSQSQPLPADTAQRQTARAPVSCVQLMAPRKDVKGKPVGQEECRLIDRGVVDAEKKYHRVDIGISGTLSGYVVKDGARQNYFTSAPEYTYTQFGNVKHPRFHGILKYEMEKGTSLIVMYPETGWNGKLYIMVHGRSGSFLRGTLRPWDKYFDPKEPFDADKYERSMLARGYAVARSWRNADGFVPGDFSAVLDDGTVWPDQNVNMVPELILDKVRLVDNLLLERLGRKPTRNYWWGHSAGAYMGLAMTYKLQFDPTLNRDADGRETISGFIHDDPGGGLFLPILERDGKDILYREPQDKANFIKSLVISHQAYPLVYSNVVVGEFDAKQVPEGVSDNVLANKRTMAKLFKEKGMDNVFRMYEVRGISHSGDEDMETNRDRDIQAVHLSRVMDGTIDLLDDWVEKGIEPPQTKADDPTVSASPAISLPETACPLGHYFPFPPARGNNSASAGRTSFASYDGAGLEPLDGQLMYVDMNKNGRRDQRETVMEAWRRLGLLAQNEPFSRTKFVACVQDAAAKLRSEKLLTDETVQLYAEEAGKLALPAP
jgi:hypothetical protein